jgi:uracil-DNA glycosylase
MADDLRAELALLSAAVRAHLEVELELGSGGLAPASSAMPSERVEPRAGPSPVAIVGSSATMRGVEGAGESGASRRSLSPEQKGERLLQLAAQASGCTACALHQKRKQSVFARGTLDAELVLVGEGPGQEEDLQGLPFVGPAGQLLDRMVDAMGFGRDEVYICNVVKCRPPDNRTPRPEEAVACARFLVPQIELVAPKVIVALGRCATEHLGVAPASGTWRGRWGVYRDIPVMPTYHPAFLLRSPEFKRVVWEDLQQVLVRLGRKPKARS